MNTTWILRRRLPSILDDVHLRRKNATPNRHADKDNWSIISREIEATDADAFSIENRFPEQRG